MSHPNRPSRPLAIHLHPNETGTTLIVRTEAEAPRITVEVRRVRRNLRGEIVSLPAADPVPNTWNLRSNDTMRVQPKSTILYNTGLHFVIPDGVVGVISEHPYNHGENVFVENLTLHQHLPFAGVTLRLTNYSLREVTIDEGDLLGLIYFHRTMRVEMKDNRLLPWERAAPLDSDDEVDDFLRSRRAYRERSPPPRNGVPSPLGWDHGRPLPVDCQTSRPSTSSSFTSGPISMVPLPRKPKDPERSEPDWPKNPVVSDSPWPEELPSAPPPEEPLMRPPPPPPPQEVPSPSSTSKAVTARKSTPPPQPSEIPTLWKSAFKAATVPGSGTRYLLSRKQHSSGAMYTEVTVDNREVNNNTAAVSTVEKQVAENAALRNASESNTDRLHRALRVDGKSSDKKPVAR
jgi:dUTPase